MERFHDQRIKCAGCRCYFSKAVPVLRGIYAVGRSIFLRCHMSERTAAVPDHKLQIRIVATRGCNFLCGTLDSFSVELSGNPLVSDQRAAKLKKNQHRDYSMDSQLSFRRIPDA